MKLKPKNIIWTIVLILGVQIELPCQPMRLTSLVSTSARRVRKNTLQAKIIFDIPEKWGITYKTTKFTIPIAEIKETIVDILSRDGDFISPNLNKIFGRTIPLREVEELKVVYKNRSSC